MADEAHDRRVRVLSIVSALLGVWLIASPWIIGAPGPSVATSGIVVGVLVLLFAIVRFARKHTAAMSWANAVLGAWTLMSPWVLGQFTGDARTWTYIITGVLITAMAAYSLTSTTTQANWRQKETGPR